MGYTLYTAKFHDVPEEMETRAFVSITMADAQEDLYTELKNANIALQMKQIKGFELRLVKWDNKTGKDVEVLAELKGGNNV